MVTTVKSLRETMGLTQQAFSVKIGFAVSTVRNWENGGRPGKEACEALDTLAQRIGVPRIPHGEFRIDGRQVLEGARPGKGHAMRTGLIQLNIAVDEDTIQDVRDIAIKRGTSTSQIIRELIEIGLETEKMERTR